VIKDAVLGGMKSLTNGTLEATCGAVILPLYVSIGIVDEAG
jgi:hypothetical protein